MIANIKSTIAATVEGIPTTVPNTLFNLPSITTLVNQLPPKYGSG